MISIKKFGKVIDVAFPIFVCLCLIVTEASLHNKNEEIANLTDTVIDYKIENNRLNDAISDYEQIISEQEIQIEAIEQTVTELKSTTIKYVGDFKIYFYCGCEQCCGKTTGMTASGTTAQDGVTVAADTSILPFGTKLYINGLGERVVQDRGGAIQGNKIDVYVDSHDKIPSIGTFTTDVWVVTE